MRLRGGDAARFPWHVVSLIFECLKGTCHININTLYVTARQLRLTSQMRLQREDALFTPSYPQTAPCVHLATLTLPRHRHRSSLYCKRS